MVVSGSMVMIGGVNVVWHVVGMVRGSCWVWVARWLGFMVVGCG